MTLDQDDSNTSKEDVDNNYNFLSSSSEKIIVLKPLRYKSTLSSQNNNTYIHKGVSNKLTMKPFPDYMHVKTHVMKEYESVDGLNISKNHNNEILYTTQLIQNIRID